MVVVDTSIWIDFFRGRNRGTRSLLNDLLDADRVALAAPVRIELLSGAGRTNGPRLRRVLSALPFLLPNDGTWNRIERWVDRASARGERFGVGDLLIAGIAVEGDAEVWSADEDFRRMERLGFIRCHHP